MPLAGGALAGYTFSVNASGGCLPFVPTSAAEVLELGDDDWDEVSIADAPFSFYGVARSAFFVGSNGYVTFGLGDERWGGDLERENVFGHFALPRISALFTDLNPSDTQIPV